jgi:hypothetical protein
MPASERFTRSTWAACSSASQVAVQDADAALRAPWRWPCAASVTVSIAELISGIR